jgi:hypothetical protein
MDAFELATKLGGEVVNGEARARIDGEWVTLANRGELTPEGKAYAEKLSAPKPVKKKAEVKTED